MRKFAGLAAVLIAAAACQDATAPRAVAVTPSRVNATKDVGDSDYIVVLRDDGGDPDGSAKKLLKGHGKLKQLYKKALKGFAVSGLSDADVDALEDNPMVESVEPDLDMSIDETQTGATWGLDRIDQHELPLNSTYGYDTDGTGVTVYIIDTGIRTTHSEFAGRASGGFSAITDGNGTNDCNGHGTHVSGTVAGTTYGVAKKASLVAVRVLGCNGSGSTSGVIAGIDWVTQNHGPNAVANMSLGGGLSSALNTAVANAVASGVTFAVAAGNDNRNACNYSPASAPSAITVGATSSNDARASFSNYGTCVDINAPGVSITSSWNTTDAATNTISGTSMATPHVAGAAALYLSGHLGSTPAQVDAALKASATTNHIPSLPSGTPNLLLFTHFSTGSQPPPPPVAKLTKSCTTFTCTFTSTSTGTITSTSWNFGDGSPAGSGSPVTHTFARQKNYSVTLTVSGANGSASTNTVVSCNRKRCS
jgi:subtilisin family serine protease